MLHTLCVRWCVSASCCLRHALVVCCLLVLLRLYSGSIKALISNTADALEACVCSVLPFGAL
jgi:hypothetical protein